MHRIQEKLLNIAREESIERYSLSELAEKVGAKSPQIIKYHLDKLKAKGFMLSYGMAENTNRNFELVAIPIVGSANCGPADIFADERVQGHLKVSSKLLRTNNRTDLFALRAKGMSMNRARVQGEPINDGDFVVVDSKSFQPVEGDYVVAVVDGMANIKKFYPDPLNNQVALISESSEDFGPIFLHEEDQSDAVIVGRVVQVLTGPSRNTI